MDKPMTLKGGIFITPKDIQILNNSSLRQAKTEYTAVRDSIQAHKKKLTVKAYCEYYGLDYLTVVEYLNPYRQ